MKSLKCPQPLFVNHLAASLLISLFTLSACPPSNSTTTSATATNTSTGSESSTDTSSTTTATSLTTTEATSTTSEETSSTTDETSSTTEEDPSTTMGTTGPEPICGDGKTEGDEECDDGANNADNGACTLACKLARCGDGLILEGNEVCDDGINDGSYGTCNPNCTLAPHCQDGIVQSDDGEECDSSDPYSGCLSSCLQAKSCLQIKNDNADLSSGVYFVKPGNIADPLSVYCDMETDGGGYTFLKFSSSKLMVATEAEARCSTYGMQLFAPRTKAHADSAYDIATNNNVSPLGDGSLFASEKFLSILGIYPVIQGQSCPGFPFNSVECSEWETKEKKPFYVSSDGLADEPSTKNCAGCSLYYDWTNYPEIDYLASNLKGGGNSLAFFCTVGDK